MWENYNWKPNSVLVAAIKSKPYQSNSATFGSIGTTLAETISHVEIVSDAAAFLARSSDSEQRDIVLLCDWNGGETGTELLKSFRARYPTSLLMIVGGRHSKAEDSMHSYSLGADNYFHFEKAATAVRARVDQLIKAAPSDFQETNDNDPDEFVRVEDLELWPDREIAMRSGQPIKLSKKEAAILKCLANNRHKPVSKEQILKEAFGLSFEPGTNVLEVHIHRLRHKIDRNHDKCLLNTVRGAGYALG